MQIFFCAKMNSGPLKIHRNAMFGEQNFRRYQKLEVNARNVNIFSMKIGFFILILKRTYILLILLDSRVNFLRPVSTVSTQNATRAQN